MNDNVKAYAVIPAFNGRLDFEHPWGFGLEEGRANEVMTRLNSKDYGLEEATLDYMVFPYYGNYWRAVRG